MTILICIFLVYILTVVLIILTAKYLIKDNIFSEYDEVSIIAIFLPVFNTVLLCVLLCIALNDMCLKKIIRWINKH